MNALKLVLGMIALAGVIAASPAVARKGDGFSPNGPSRDGVSLNGPSRDGIEV
jgi:hypothetical protein